MASIQLQNLNQHGSSLATSSSISPPTDTRSIGIAEISSPERPAYSRRHSAPQYLPQQHSQQQQHQPLQELRRLQRQATTEETSQLQERQQRSSQEQRQPQSVATQVPQEIQTPQATQDLPAPVQQGLQRNRDQSLLSKIITVLAFILAIGMIYPTAGQYMTGVWSSAKDYQDWCRDEEVGCFIKHCKK